MQTPTMLGLALLVGMHHALEADHVAAVSSLVSGRKKLSEIVSHGLTWGFGHALTLFLFAGMALSLGQAVPPSLAMWLETAVGVLLVALGAQVLWRLWRDRIHFHGHRHDGGAAHFHAHSHAGETLRHEWSPHRHLHRFHWRALLVGMTHGMAGSAALLLLAVTQVRSVPEALIYVLLFGAGSIIGMAGVSTAIGIPLTLSARFPTWTNRGLQAALGTATIAAGLVTLNTTNLTGL